MSATSKARVFPCEKQARHSVQGKEKDLVGNWYMSFFVSRPYISVSLLVAWETACCCRRFNSYVRSVIQTNYLKKENTVGFQICTQVLYLFPLRFHILCVSYWRGLWTLEIELVSYPLLWEQSQMMWINFFPFVSILGQFLLLLFL